MKPTYPQARTVILNRLRDLGWSIVTTNATTGRPMVVPHATRTDGRVRLWFKPHAVWVTEPQPNGHVSHTLGEARSTHLDIRTEADRLLNCYR